MMTNLINYITNELGYKVLRISYFGSHQFNLNNEDSDIDLMCIVTRDKDYYTQLFEPDLSISSKVIDGMDVQFLDIKRYLQLLSKSNFNAVSVIYNSIFTRPGYEHFFSKAFIPYTNVNKVAHHALGLINNRTSGEQKLHMKAYFTLLLDFLLEYKHMPESLRYDYLLSISYSPIAESILTSKKNNTVFIYSDIWCNITHDKINEELLNNNNLVSICSEKWNKLV
ncbi:MAG: nucleotidyltransferase domain-containing protein [Candidatus Riesia sp.]|nr:nucleotidyltransferase domain-containing protein [Candidatus Riesia sp.]